MLLIDPPALVGIAALVTSIATLVWAFRRKP
jgi:hypothetical protein